MNDYSLDYEPERECNTCGCTLWWKRVDEEDEFLCPDCHSWFWVPADIPRHAITYKPKYPDYAGLRWFGIDAVFLFHIPRTMCALIEGVEPPLIMFKTFKLTDIWCD